MEFRVHMMILEKFQIFFEKPKLTNTDSTQANCVESAIKFSENPKVSNRVLPGKILSLQASPNLE